jgi:hypothetical protein
MLILTVSGKARAGKDTTSELLKEILEKDGKKVLVTHYADILKFMCKNYFGWDGNKDEKGRSLLQHVGTDIVRKKDPDFWVKYMKSVLNIFDGEWDVVIIADVRFPNEIELLKEDYNVFSVNVVRPNFDNGLTDEQKQHPSECSLDGYIFNYDLVNDGSLDVLKCDAAKLVRILKIARRVA